jgi:hypothetical protein
VNKLSDDVCLWLQRARNAIRFLHQLGNPMCSASFYEEWTESEDTKSSVRRRILIFLDLPNHQLHTDLEIQHSDTPIEETCSNFADIERVLSGSQLLMCNQFR